MNDSRPMSFTLSNDKQRWEHRCDNCKRLVGVGSGLRADEQIMDVGVGYVTSRGKNADKTFCGGTASMGCRAIYVHPLACSDKCEDRLLETWPVMDAEDVHADDWLPDFRDRDIERGGARPVIS